MSPDAGYSVLPLYANTGKPFGPTRFAYQIKTLTKTR